MTRGRVSGDLRARLRAASEGGLGGAEQDWAAALGATLAEAGPLPHAFARYLAWRADLLRLVCCEELAAARAPAPLPAAGAARRAVERCLGVPLEDAFSHFDPTVLVRDPLLQWHRAKLPSGRAALVQIARPDVLGSLDEGTPLLSEITDLLAADRDDVPWRQLLADFDSWTESRRDLEARRRLWETLESDELLRDAWVAPVLVEELSRGGLLVVEEPEGAFLGEALRERGGTPAGADLARRLCLAWLELTAFGGVLVEGLTGGDVFVLEDDRLLLLGGAPVAVDQEQADAFLDSIAAAALGHPDAVWRALLRLVETPADTQASARLLVRLRQASPLRDDGLGRRYRGARLAESLFVAWRLLRQVGCEPGRALRRLATGVAALESHARVAGTGEGARRRDPLAEAVVDLQVMRAAGAVRRALGPVAWRGRLEEALPLVSELPERLEAWLDRRTSPSAAPVRRREGSGRWAALGVLLALIAVVVAVVARLGTPPGWVEDAAAAVCLALGAGAVWVAWGGRTTIHRR